VDLCKALTAAGCVAIAPDLHAFLPAAPTKRLAALHRVHPCGKEAMAPLHAAVEWMDAQPWGAQRPSLTLLGMGPFGGAMALQYASRCAHEVDCAAAITVDGAVCRDVGVLSCPVLGVITPQEGAPTPWKIAAFETLLRRSSVPVTIARLHDPDRVAKEVLTFLEKTAILDPGAKSICSYAGW
jgi:dienelactone hydrolase